MAVPQTRGRVTYLLSPKKTAEGKKIFSLYFTYALYHLQATWSSLAVVQNHAIGFVEAAIKFCRKSFHCQSAAAITARLTRRDFQGRRSLASVLWSLEGSLVRVAAFVALKVTSLQLVWRAPTPP